MTGSLSNEPWSERFIYHGSRSSITAGIPQYEQTGHKHWKPGNVWNIREPRSFSSPARGREVLG